jgi:hypothetical protein
MNVIPDGGIQNLLPQLLIDSLLTWGTFRYLEAENLDSLKLSNTTITTTTSTSWGCPVQAQKAGTRKLVCWCNKGQIRKQLTTAAVQQSSCDGLHPPRFSIRRRSWTGQEGRTGTSLALYPSTVEVFVWLQGYSTAPAAIHIGGPSLFEGNILWGGCSNPAWERGKNQDTFKTHIDEARSDNSVRRIVL